MFVKRIFYVTQGSLGVWFQGANGPAEVATFGDDDAGFREFDTYLHDLGEIPSAMLIDVIEEEFASDTIPKLSWRDRGSLLQRRCQKKFRRTPYRLSVLHGKSKTDAGEFDVLHSAISNHELIDPWLQIILRHRTPLSGVFSVPLLAPKIFRKLGAGHGSVLCVAPHQGDKLRQAFLTDGHLRSARLTQAPTPDDKGYAEFVITEAVRSRRYLERMRLVSGMEVLKVKVVAEAATAERISELTAGHDGMEFEFVDASEAGSKLQGHAIAASDRFEEVYLSAVMRSRPKYTYAQAGEDRYWVMQRIRRALIGGTAAVAAVCSVAAAVLASDTLFMRGQVAEVESQLAQLSETFRRENERFNPIQADSHEMKLTVDTGDFILENRLPVPWVMNQLGAVLGGYPDIRVSNLSWEVEIPTSNVPPPRRGERPRPVPVNAVNSINAVVTADIVPFDGDMRSAFSRIDSLARDLEDHTDFSSAMIIEYPFNNNPEAAVSGEISRYNSVDFVRFKMNISYQVPGTSGVEGGSSETI